MRNGGIFLDIFEWAERNDIGCFLESAPDS